MPLRRAHEVNFKPPPRCPICGVGVTASGRNQPIAVDEKLRPYCRLHGHLVDTEYDQALAEYERIRAAQVDYLKTVASQGVKPTDEEIEEIRREWSED